MQHPEIPQSNDNPDDSFTLNSPSDEKSAMNQQKGEVDDWFRSAAQLSPIHSEGESLRLDTSEEQSPQKQSPPSFGSFSWTGLHHRHPVKPEKPDGLSGEGRTPISWTTPDRHSSRTRRRSLRTEQSSPVPWSPYRNNNGTSVSAAISSITRHGIFLKPTLRTRWLQLIISTLATLLVAFLFRALFISQTIYWQVSSMLGNRYESPVFPDRPTQQQSQPWWPSIDSYPSPILVRQLQRQQLTRPPPMSTSFEGLSKAALLYQLRSDDATTTDAPKKSPSSASWAPLESLCGITAQQASLHNSSHFPQSFALYTGQGNVSIVGGEMPIALRLAHALQVHCQARIKQLIWQGPEQELDRLELHPLYQSILLHSNASNELQFVDHSAWALHRETTHLVYFAEQPTNGRQNNSLDLVARVKDTVQRICKSQHRPYIVLVESSDTSTALADWMAGVFSLRTPVVRVRIPKHMTWSTPPNNQHALREKRDSETANDIVRGEHVLSAIVAAMQWHLPGTTQRFLLDQDSTTTRRYLGGWTPFGGECEWCLHQSMTDQLDSCASECATPKKCSPSIWNTSLSRDLTDGCKVVLYTSVPIHDEDRHLIHADYDDEGEVCNVAFVHRTSHLADLALQKVPNEQLLKFGLQASRDIHDQKLALLNGRLMYRGWVLIWPERSVESLEDWSLVKLAPTNLFSKSVQYAIFSDPFEKNAYRNVTFDQVQDFISNMESSVQDARLARLGPKHFILPPEPTKRAILQTHRIRRPSQLAHKRLTLSLAVKILDNNRREPKPVKRHREFYHVMSKWFQPTRKPVTEPWYRYDVNPFLVDTSQVVHDLRHPAGKDLRCEWYEHHRPFASSLDALSLAHVLTLRNMERRQRLEEPDDRALRHWKYWPEQQRLKKQDWIPMLMNYTSTDASSLPTDISTARLRYRMIRAPVDSSALTRALAAEQEEAAALEKERSVLTTSYVHLLSS